MLVSFTPSIAVTQFPPGAGEGFDSRLFQPSDLTSRNLVACQRFSDTHMRSETRSQQSQMCASVEPRQTEARVRGATLRRGRLGSPPPPAQGEASPPQDTQQH